MITDIQTFRSQGMPDGLARPSKFEMYFPQLPSVVNAPAVRQSLFKCHASQHPSFRVGVIDVYYMGRPVPTVANRIFEPYTVRFYNGIDWNLRDYFEAWSNRANTLVGNQTELTDTMNALSGGYAVDGAIVRQFSQFNILLRSYEFFGIFPEVVGQIELNWEAANRVETFDVQFRYAYHIPSVSDTTQAAPGTYPVGGTIPATQQTAGIIAGVAGPSINPAVTVIT